MLFAVFAAVAAFGYFATFTRQVTTVILVRHAEKNIEPSNPNPDLSPAGQARARELVRILGNSGINAIYATQYSRTQQTAAPLAEKLGLPVNKIDSSSTAELVRQIRTAHRGETVFIAGHNNTVPQIISAIGGETLPVIPDNEFDNLYIVTVIRFGRAKVVKLKYGAPSPTGGGSGTMVP